MNKHIPGNQSPPASKPESESEKRLFDDLLETILKDDTIAPKITDYQLDGEINTHIQKTRHAIWDRVAVERLRVDDAEKRVTDISEAILPGLEAAVRKSKPDLVQQEAELGKAAGKLEDASSQLQLIADNLRLLRNQNQALASEDDTADKIRNIQDAITNLEALTDTVEPDKIIQIGVARQDDEKNRRRRRLRWPRRRRAPASRKAAGSLAEQKPPTPDQFGVKYQDALEELMRTRRNLQDVYTARKRVEMQIANDVNRAARQDEAWREAQNEAAAASTALKNELADAILNEVQRYINTHTSTVFNIRMRALNSRGLYRSLSSGDIIETPAIQMLEDTLTRMSGVSIGLAGPRGSGKTTAISYLHAKLRLASERSPGPIERTRWDGEEDQRFETASYYLRPDYRPHLYSVLLSAPVKYQPRDFILHLFAELCRKVAGPDADRKIAPVGQPERTRLQWLPLTLSAAGLVAGAVAAVVAVSLDPTSLRPPTALFAGSSAVAGACLAMWEARSRRPGLSPGPASARARPEHLPDPAWARPTYSNSPKTVIPGVGSGLVMTAIAVAGAALLPGLLGNILWIAGICGFFLAAAGLATGQPSKQVPINRSRRFRAMISRAIFWLRGHDLRSAAFSAMAPGVLILLALRFPPKNELLLFTGCLVVMAAAVAFMPLADLQSQCAQTTNPDYYRRLINREPPGSGDAGVSSEDSSRGSRAAQNIHLALNFSYALRAIGVLTAASAYLEIRSSINLVVTASTVLGGTLVVLGVLILNAALFTPAKARAEAEPAVRLAAEDGRDGFTLADEESPQPGGNEQLADIALDYLRDIKFQQTFSIDRTHSWSLTAPGQYLGLGGQKSFGTSLSSEPRTLPEIVARFQDFLTILHSGRNRVIVGIDELDKLSENDAQLFLGDIKAVFGIRGCNFVVSVSEDAAADFERRGVPFRSAFDSTFDDVISIGYFDYKTSASVLLGRVDGLTELFVLLCHSLSGGLARDLIRMARTLVTTTPAGNETLAGVTQRLCRNELESKMRGACWQLARMNDNPWGADLLADTLANENTIDTPESHFERSAHIRSWMERVTGQLHNSLEGDARVMAALQRAEEMATFATFTGTVCEFFTKRITQESMNDAFSGFNNPRSVERLAAARQAMATTSTRANRYLDDFRKAWDLGEVVRSDPG